jgi:hypothetical protein
MISKPFEQSLHDQHDSDGKRIVIDFFKNRNIEARENPDKYGVDIILYRNEKPIGYAEVEVRLMWHGAKFPYSIVNVPFRKKKLLDNELPTYFFAVNKDLTHVLCCDSEVILNSPVEENPNRFVKRHEYFYKIPLEKTKTFSVAS